MNEYTKYVDEYISKSRTNIDIYKLNDIRKKFGRKEIKPPSTMILKNKLIYSIFGLLVIGFVFNFSLKKPSTGINPIKKEIISNINNPKRKLTIDEQALYWTYAIYDFEKFKKTFSPNEDISLNQISSRKNLISILPKVSRDIIEKIYAYDQEILNSVVNKESK